MKKLLISAILTLGVSTTFAAQGEGFINLQVEGETSTMTSQAQIQQKVEVSADIKELIQKVKTAPPQEKYIYMNQLKQKLMELSEEKRKEVMHEVVRELKHRGKEEALQHVSGKNERAEKEVGKEHELMKGENRMHREENTEHRNEMKERMQERMMEREHELEERKAEIQERTNFRQTEREERIEEHRMEQEKYQENMEYRGSFHQNGENHDTNFENERGNMNR